MALAVASASAQTGPSKHTGRKAGVVRLGTPTTYLKEGLTLDEVFRLLGERENASEREDNGAIVTTYEFQRGETRVLVAEFVNNTLVRSRTETRPLIAQVR
jgi:hypothetical protein